MAKAMTATAPESRNRTMIVAAVVFAAIAALLLFIALQSSGGGGGGTEAAVSTDVVVAAQNIETNTVVTADMIEVRSVSIDEAITGSFADVESVVGLPARYPIQEGEQVTTSKVGLDAIRDGEDLAFVLQPGYRAVAIEVSEMTSVGGLLLPGNFVDLIVVLDGGGEGLDDNKALTVLQNIEVLAVAQEAQEPIPAADTSADGEEGATGSDARGQRPEEVERQPRARTVTVAVTPEQAQLLALLQAEGGGSEVAIMLSLRPVGETEDASVPELFPPSEFILPPQPQS